MSSSVTHLYAIVIIKKNYFNFSTCTFTTKNMNLQVKFEDLEFKNLTVINFNALYCFNMKIKYVYSLKLDVTTVH